MGLVCSSNCLGTKLMVKIYKKKFLDNENSVTRSEIKPDLLLLKNLFNKSIIKQNPQQIRIVLKLIFRSNATLLLELPISITRANKVLNFHIEPSFSERYDLHIRISQASSFVGMKDYRLQNLHIPLRCKFFLRLQFQISVYL